VSQAAICRTPRLASLHGAEESRGCQPPRERRRLRWCIECCRLFKAGMRTRRAGPGLKRRNTPPPTHRQDRPPHPADRRPGGLQQEDGGDRKPLGKMDVVSPAHGPHRPQQLDPTHQSALGNEHKALKRIDMAKHAEGLHPERSRRGMKYICNTTSTTWIYKYKTKKSIFVQSYINAHNTAFNQSKNY
jgi:hypothetical protein